MSETKDTRVVVHELAHEQVLEGCRLILQSQLIRSNKWQAWLQHP